MREIYFLSYIPRSGSTFFSLLMNQYSDIIVTPEARFPKSLIGLSTSIFIKNEKMLFQYINYIYTDYKFIEWQINKELLIRTVNKNLKIPFNTISLLKLILNLYAEINNPRAKIIIFKQGILSIFQRKTLISKNIKVINIIRNPNAIYLSQKNARDSIFNFKMTYSSIAFSKSYNNYVKSIQKNMYNYSLKYEDLILNKKVTLYEIIKWLNVDSTLKNKNDYIDKIPNRQKKLHKNLDSTPKNNSLNKWEIELSKREINTINNLCDDSLNVLDYERINVNSKFFYLPIFFDYYYDVLINKFIKRIIYILLKNKSIRQKIIIIYSKIRKW